MVLLELAAQCALVGLLAGWLAVGAYENIRSPSVNFELVRDVFSMDSIADEYPDIHAEVKRNKITNDAVHWMMFRVVVLAEVTVAAALTISTLLLILSMFGAVSASYAIVFAGWATLGFILIWGLFLVGGNWFHYWVSHQSSQHTHHMMTLWGIATLIVLLI